MITLQDIRQARTTIAAVVARTPLIRYYARGADHQLWLKPECFQPVGSFKIRGAYNKIASLTPAERELGVIAYSSGNHAQGVAYAARAFGVKAVIVMPSSALRNKLEATSALGAEIIRVGPGSSERKRKAEELANEHGYVIVPPYNDDKIIAGQGTIGLEILEDLENLHLVFVPIGGGGLISGIAGAIKQSAPSVRVIGVEPEVANDAQESLRTGRIVTLSGEQTERTIADGLRAQQLGDLNFEHIRTFVDDIVTVTEDEIRHSIRQLAMDSHLVVEPSGAVAFAASVSGHYERPSESRAVAVISGGNIDPKLLASVIEEAPPNSEPLASGSGRSNLSLSE